MPWLVDIPGRSAFFIKRNGGRLDLGDCEGVRTERGKDREESRERKLWPGCNKKK